ncbi:MAG: hypothetical protein JW862_10455 [Anaerolineales bacterium]|nr:hypothetical protein [Anaerolineales bacterium]
MKTIDTHHCLWTHQGKNDVGVAQKTSSQDGLRWRKAGFPANSVKQIWLPGCILIGQDGNAPQVHFHLVNQARYQKEMQP